MRKELVRRLAIFSLAVLSVLAAGLSARAANLVQEFYLPMPEQQIYQANAAIVPGVGATNFSTFSIVATGDGTVINYDQWEDGYEVNLASPVQSTTQIWGDGNDANGICPGFAHDPAGLVAGTVITLTNNVPLPRNPSVFLWDARDRVAANKALVISRAAWPVNPGPVFAGAAGVLSTIDYGTNYISPVGQDMTNGLFKYVGMFVMAAQNNTAVTLDPNGNGVGTSSIVLNQGESYLVNGGIKKGGRITATKPVQADLLVGHVGANYASDWFTLYPVSAWDNTYYTPVATSASGNPAYVYLYNPATNAININYSTRSGSGSFSIPGTNGVFQFKMPVASGASFASAGGQNFFAICTVGASPSADTAYNWGFTLVPKAALTTEATVGWGPGSADGTVNGSPVWVTALAGTTLYVDYKGDHAGPLTDPNGKKYDTNFTMVALQSQKVYDPSKNQTGMRVYTVDGTLITAAWGEDPDVAAPGNPYIDAGTTVLPFPTPVLIKTATIVTDTPPTGLSIGDVIQYSVQIGNKGLLPLGNTVVIDAPSTNLTYVANSTTLDGSPIPDSVSGTAFPLDAPGYTIPVILSQGNSTFTYRVAVNASGSVSNNVNIGGTTISSQTYLAPPPTNGASCNLNFTDTNGVSQGLYAAGAKVFVWMTNAAANTSASTIQTISVTVQNQTHGDLETITLTETGVNTGVFRNIAGLPTSATAGLGSQDGTLNVTAGDFLNVTYTDPSFGNTCNANAMILIPALNKQLYLSVNGSTNGVQALNRIDPIAYAHSPTRNSIDIGSAGGTTTANAIGVDGSYVTNSTATTLTFNYATGSGTNRFMLVSVGVQHNSGGAPSVSSVTYNGAAMNMVSSSLKASSNPKYGLYVYSLTNPATGNNAVSVTWNGGDSCIVGVNTFSNVNQSLPLADTNSVAPGSAITVNSATNQLVFGAVYNNGNVGLAAGQNAAVRWTNNYTATYYALGSTVTGSNSATTSISWTTSAYAVGVSINPSTTFVAGGSGPATNATTFVQTPVFASAFTMPSNNIITITNYITLTNGTLTANPAISATLQYNGTNFMTLSSPVYSAVNSNLVWSGTLSSNVTVPAGATISYVISNGVSGTAFHVDYDSTTKPSKITLPASTVIAINTFGIYDAPYPGGSLVTTPVAGSTLYVRANVSDPFGSYDITSLGLAFTAPNTNNNFNVTLNDTSVVATNASSKTYEYQWATTPATGNYNIAATANEGTEGVSAVTSASIMTIFLDLGTPSTTEFTSGNNGVATNSYLATSSVCVRVTDINRDTNSATAQSIIATVASSSGDSEILTLTETGTNTGIFTACINTSTNSNAAPNDGTLFAPVGSILTASYTDPTDTSDSTSATATIQPVPGTPGVVINKTIVSPSGGQVGVGQPVVYNLQIVNVGSTTLPSLKITDTFTASKLSYTSASATPDTVASGTLTWNNLGAFTPGQSTNITVNFTTLATGTATNSATANGSTITNSSSVTLAVNSAALNVTKILLAPTNQPVAVGSNVTFRITIQNVGNTIINMLPFEDTYSGAYYQYVSATIPANGSGFGTLIWTNLAVPALGTNAIITNDVTMLVVGQGSPANNTATADFAFDVFGNPVPVASSTIGVTTASAGINGHVYNDINQSGVFTNGDTGLSGVTIQLFTDPNADGNPSDGTLVQLTTTDGNGYYELLNLNLGHYVVVETDLAGYSSSAPVNNRLPLNLTTLTTSTNNNFFDYLPAPSLYSTFSGTVYNDVLGTGTNTAQSGLGYVTIDLVQDVNSNGIADLGEPVASSTLTDTNGTYSLIGITPGYYVIRESDAFGYYSTGDSQPPNNNQISFSTTNGIVSTNRNFFDRLSPVANDDTNSTGYFAPVIISPLANDVSPNGDALTVSNATSAFGIVVINPGATNITFTPTNIGAATISYTIVDQHGGSASAVITVGVSPKALTITANSTGKIYGQTVTFAGTEFTVVGLTNGDSVSSVTLNSAGAVNTAIVGGYQIIPSAAAGSGLANYAITYATTGTLTVNPATLGITANSTNRLYNTANPSFTYTPSGFLNGDTASVLSGTPSLTTTAILSSPVGTYPIAATNGTLSATNYVFSFTNSTLTVVGGTYSIAWTNPPSIVYGTPLGTNQNNASATVGGSYVYNPTNGVVLPVGTNTLSVIFTPTDTNYASTNLSVQLVVTPAPLTLTASNQSKIYGAALSLGTSAFGSSGLVNGETVGSVTLTSAGAPTNAAAGTYAIVPSAATGGTFNPTNYSITYSNGLLTVNAATLTVTANSTNKIYGVANPAFTASYGGFVNGDTTGVLSGSPSLTTAATTNSGVGSYPIVATNGTLSAANYVFSFVNGTLTIGKASLTVTANNTNKVYGATNPTFTASYSGFANGETTSVLSGSPSLTTSATISSPGGSYPIVATNGSLSAANYAFSFVNGTLTIVGGNYGITWTNPVSIVYGTPLGTNQNNASATVPGGYVYNPTNGTALPAGTNVLTVVFTPSDTNYASTNVSVQLVVTPAPLTITANSTNKIYNTTLTFGTTAFTSSGLVNGDSVSNVTLTSTGAASPAPVGAYPIVPSAAVGSGLTNYSITYSNGTLTVFSGLYGITWTNPASIVYGTPLGTNQNNASATIPGGYAYNPTNGTVLPAGTNLLSVVFTPTDTNYVSTNVTVTLLVTPATLTVTGSNMFRVYGQPNPILGGSLTGVVNGDNITATYATAAISNSPTGVYPILPTLVDPNSRLVNYSVTTNNGTLTVTPALLGITANPTNRLYGAANPAFTYTANGFVNGDTASVLSGAPSLTTTATTNSPVGTYAIVATNGTLSATNYSFSFTNGLLSVNLAPPLVLWPVPTNIVYGTPLGTNQNNATSTVPGSVVYTPTNGTVLPVGTNTLSVVYTPTDTNYASTNLTVPLIVTPASLTVTANNASRVVGQPNPVFTGILTGVVSGDNITATYSTTATTNSPAGSYPIIPSLVDPNSRLVNYTVTTNNGTLTVTNAPNTADLVVVQSGPTSGVAGSNLVFTVSVTNRGPSVATGIIVSNQLASGFTFVSASGSGANNGGLVLWSIASLPVNGVTNLTVTAFAAEGGSFTNIASGASSLVDTNSTNNDGSLANAKSHTTISALADVAIFKVGSTNGYRGLAITYTITATNAGPSTATNVVVQDNLPAGLVLQSASGSYTATASAVTWSSVTLAPGTFTNFDISLVVTSTITSFTNIAFSTSPTADPNPTNNNGSFNKSRVTTKVSPSADVVVLLVGPPSAVQGSNFVYTLTITNAGPSTSSNIVVSDSLPLSLTFVSASSGGKNTNNVITWPTVKALPVGGFTNFTLTVKAPSGGVFTNIASALAVTFDPNATNNSGVSPASQALTTVAPAQLDFLAGTPVFNPQTGLFEENVTVTNIGSVTILGFRMYVGGLTGGITLYNATGTNNGVPYVDYLFPLDPSNTVTVTLELFSPLRVTPTNSISVEPIQPGGIDLSSTNRSVAVSRIFTDTRIEGDTRFVIEFASVPGKTYNIIYSSDLVTWKVATPSVTASANVTQWYDDGPPKTESKPSSVGARYYRVITLK